MEALGILKPAVNFLPVSSFSVLSVSMHVCTCFTVQGEYLRIFSLLPGVNEKWKLWRFECPEVYNKPKVLIAVISSNDSLDMMSPMVSTSIITPPTHGWEREK